MSNSEVFTDTVWEVKIITPTREVLDITSQVDPELLKSCYFAEEIAADLEAKYGTTVSVKKIERVTRWK